MKIIFTLAILSVFSLTALTGHSTTVTYHDHPFTAHDNNKDKKISIASSREDGGMQLRFTAEKKGEAVITIMDDSRKIVLHQTNKVSNGSNTILLKDATGLAEGSYTVRLISNNETYTTRFLIWK